MRFLTTHEEIAAAESRFQREMEAAATEFMEINVGNHGGCRDVRVGWNAETDREIPWALESYSRAAAIRY